MNIKNITFPTLNDKQRTNSLACNQFKLIRNILDTIYKSTTPYFSNTSDSILACYFISLLVACDYCSLGCFSYLSGKSRRMETTMAYGVITEKIATILLAFICGYPLIIDMLQASSRNVYVIVFGTLLFRYRRFLRA